MTKKEFLLAVAALENEELSSFAKEEVEKMEKALEARKSKLSHTQRGNIRYKEIILDNLSEEPQTASTIAGMLGVSVQKASALCRQLVAEERVQVVDVAVPKKGKQKGYFI